MGILGYVGAGLVGVALYLVITGLSKGRVSAPGVATGDERDDVPVDTRQRELGAPLAERAVAPLRRVFVRIGERLRPGDARQERGLNRRLDAAGVSLPPEAFYASKVVAAAATLLVAVLVVVLTRWELAVNATLLVAAAPLGFLVPDLWLLNTTQRRQQQLSRELPEGLDLLALTVRAGLGLEQGVAEVAREIPGPLGQELDRMLREQQLGRSRREAIESLRDRNTGEDIQRLTNALLHAERLGTPIAQTLRVQARELRRLRRARARERAGKAPVKLLVPLILFVFPAMFVVVIGPGVIGIIQNLF